MFHISPGCEHTSGTTREHKGASPEKRSDETREKLGEQRKIRRERKTAAGKRTYNNRPKIRRSQQLAMLNAQ